MRVATRRPFYRYENGRRTRRPDNTGDGRAGRGDDPHGPTLGEERQAARGGAATWEIPRHSVRLGRTLVASHGTGRGDPEEAETQLRGKLTERRFWLTFDTGGEVKIVLGSR